MSNSINDIILKTITDNNMIVSNDKIVVGVSGGADSMCLLHFLISIKYKFSINIIAAHINHNLRGAEAVRDQTLVECFCRQRGIECRVLSADINKICSQTGEGSEECGRRIRYEFFKELSGISGKIATAHTLSDSAETLIFNIARGTGLKGLQGIPNVRGNIIRPLINITRQQVEEYCSENNIKYITDSSNLTDDYSRNKIRHAVVPVLKDINPGFENAVQKLTAIVSEQLNLVNALAENLLVKAKIPNGYSCQKLLEADKTVLKQAIINVLNRYGCNEYAEKHIRLIVEIISNYGVIQLPNNFVVSTKQGIFRVYNKDENEEKAYCNDNYNVLMPQKSTTVVINEQKINVKIITKQAYDEILTVNKFLVNNSVDYDIIHFETMFRTRAKKDVFKQRGRGVTKTLKKLFTEAKIPQENRDKILLLAYQNEVVWLQGVGVSENYKVTSNTKTVAVIETDGL